MTPPDQPATAEAGAPPALVTALSAASMAQLLRDKGYRAEVAADPQDAATIRSAAGGVPFQIRLGNPAPGRAGHHLDAAFVCALTVEIETMALVAQWNATRRFARAYQRGGVAVLEMDILVAGGVAPPWLAAELEIWDHLLQEWLVLLRSVARAAAVGAKPATD